MDQSYDTLNTSSNMMQSSMQTAQSVPFNNNNRLLKQETGDNLLLTNDTMNSRDSEAAVEVSQDKL